LERRESSDFEYGVTDAASDPTSRARAAFAPIERRKAYELVSENLAAQIGTVFQVGDVVPPERELAQLYGVGRSSVREALRIIESRGLIESAGNNSFVIAEPRSHFSQGVGQLLADGQTDMQQLFEVRGLLEGEVAALAAARRTGEQLARIRAANEAMAAGLNSEESYIRADIAFHIALAEATGNRFVLHLMHAIRDEMHTAFGTVFHVPGSPAHSVAEHQGIADAIAEGSASLARRRMNRHISRVRRSYESRS
jgi:GntR family transcriptional repressor for pyruvate dehydrogenase complex